MAQEANIGDSVFFHDEKGDEHEALVTCVWSETCVNLVYVSGDENREDEYGRQIERKTSVPRRVEGGVHGFYWRTADEERNPTVAPKAT